MRTNYRTLTLIAAVATGLAFMPGMGRGQAASPSPAAAVESPSLLLERGLYDEETKGDLDAAIATYRQVITQARANDSLAAQAEYHLAQCQIKKGDAAGGNATLEKLMNDYPNETALIAKARAITAAGNKLLPIPWVDGERLLLRLSSGSGMDLGMTEYRSDYITTGTQPVWRVGARTTAAMVSSLTTVDVVPDTMMPLASHFQHSALGTVDATYTAGQVELRKAGKAAERVQVTGDVYDNEEAVNGIRRLPLAPGYKITLPIFTTFGGTQIPVGLEVTGVERITVPAGTFDCYKVALSLGQTFWFSTDAKRYLVQYDAGLISAKLYAIGTHGPEAPVSFSEGELGVSLTAPPQWVVIRLAGGQPDGESLIRTYDPNGDAVDGGIRYFTTSAMPAEYQKSSQVWAEAEFKGMGNGLGSDVKMRADGWKPYTVDGAAGVGGLIDSTVGKKRMTNFLLYVHGGKRSELFVLIAPADKFDALYTQFQTIIASYKRQQ